jgi:DNA-binding HxlR family transcriptional regulator
MKRLPDDDCGFASALNAIGGKWKTEILWEINLAPRRFGELRRLLAGISEKVLAQQLREMEADDLLTPRISGQGAAGGVSGDRIRAQPQRGRDHILELGQGL